MARSQAKRGQKNCWVPQRNFPGPADSGGCTVTYTLGTFSSATHFTGSFTVTFSNGPGCTSCVNQSFNIAEACHKAAREAFGEHA